MRGTRFVGCCSNENGRVFVVRRRFSSCWRNIRIVAHVVGGGATSSTRTIGTGTTTTTTGTGTRRRAGSGGIICASHDGRIQSRSSLLVLNTLIRRHGRRRWAVVVVVVVVVGNCWYAKIIL